MPPQTRAEIGSSGLAYAQGGIITEELHPNLTGRKALEVWRAMKDNDALVGAVLLAIDSLVRQVDWRVEQKEASDEDVEFLEGCMDDMSSSWGDCISEILSMLPFGFSFHEIVYKKRQGPQKPGSKTPSSKFSDGKVGWRKLPGRAQETLDHWEFDDEGGVSAFVQRAYPDFEDKPIPMEKGLLFRTTVYKNNPEGRSILRSAYVSWFYKKRIQTIEGTGIERDLAGFPVFWLPAEYLRDDASPAEKAVVNTYIQMGENIRRDKQEFMIMPLAYDDKGNKAFDFSLTASAGTRTFDLNQVIGRYNQEIAMSALADFILLGHERVGSFALSDDKTDMFAVALGTILDIIADVFNRYAVPRLFDLNAMDLTALPEIAHGDIESPDLAKLAAFLTSLSGSGMPLFPDTELENWLREQAGMPEKSEEAIQRQEEQERQEEEDRARMQEQFNQPPQEDTGANTGGGTGGGRPVVGEPSELAGL